MRRGDVEKRQKSANDGVCFAPSAWVADGAVAHKIHQTPPQKIVLLLFISQRLNF
jgi:hypothetical protein